MTNEQLNMLLNELSSKIGALEVDNISLKILVDSLQKENEELKRKHGEEMK